MRSARRKWAGLLIPALCVVVLAWEAGPALAAPSGQPGNGNQHQEKLKQLRQLNKRQKRPNVIVIDTDDMNQSDIWVMQKTLALLGSRGTTFSNSYVSYPLCCPSRATFLTGQYAHNHGVLTDQRFGDLDSSNTLAVWLRRAKYRTAMVGKYLNGYGITQPRLIPPGWKQWFALTHGTEQKRYKFDLNENGKIRYYPRKVRNYIDFVLDSKVNGLLKRWAPSPKPFFIYYNPNNPHGERALPPWSTRDPEPAPQYLGHFGDIPAPRYPNFDEADEADKPQIVRDLPRLSDAELADIDRRYRGRIESLLSVDDEVARIVGLVRKYGDKRKTLFIFTSDNGLQMGAHRIEFKNYLYEESERVPLIIRGPGFPAGVTRDQLVANIDLAPTIVKLTRARPARVMDGMPLQPLAQDSSVEANRDLLFESFDLGETNFQDQSFGIRRGQWAYNEYFPVGNGPLSDHAELYNLTTDPYELHNLLYDPPGPTDPSPTDVALASELSARLTQLRNCSGATCR